MGNRNTITVQLTVNDDGSVVMQKFGKTGEEAINRVVNASPKATSALNLIKSSYLELSAKAATAYMLVMKAVQYMDEAAQAMQQESSFRIMAESYDTNADKMISNMKNVTRETIDDSALMGKAVKMMTLGFDPSQIERFTGVIHTAAQIAGTSDADAYDRLADAISTRMPKALIQMGAVTRTQMKIVNDAINNGADETMLYELAMANLELKQKQLSGTTDDASVSMQRFHAQLQQTREAAGGLLITGMQKLYSLFQGIGVVSLLASSGIYKVLAAKNALNATLHTGDNSKYWADLSAQYLSMAQSDMAAAVKLSGMADDNLRGTAEVGRKATAAEIENSRKRVKAREDELKSFSAAAEAKKKSEELNQSWKEVAMTLNARIDSEGLNELKKQLIDNQLEADKLIAKYKTIPGAVDLIKRAQEVADSDAIKKAEEKSLDAFEKRIQEELERDRKVYEERERLRQDRLTAEREIFQDLAGFEDSYYSAVVALIDDQSDKYRELQISEVSITAWATEQKRQAFLKLARTVSGYGSFSDGWNEGLKDWVKDNLATEFAQAEMMSKTTATAMRESFSNLFFDSLKGETKNFSVYWNSFADAVLKKMTDNIAAMVTEWIMGLEQMKQAQSVINSTSGLIETGLSFVAEAIGGSMVPVAHTGGVVGRDSFPSRVVPASAFIGAPRYHSGKGEIPAILQDGESVLTENQMAALGAGMQSGGGGNANTYHIYCWDSKSLEDFIKRNANVFHQNTVDGVKDNKTRSALKRYLS